MNSCHHAKGPKRHGNGYLSLSIWRNQQAGVNYLVFQDPGANSFNVICVLATEHVYVGEIEKSLTTCYTHLDSHLGFHVTEEPRSLLEVTSLYIALRQQKTS